MNRLFEDLQLVEQHTRALWEEMRGRRLFLTGGTGFFGCWLVESFCHMNRVLGLNAQVTILTRHPESFIRKCPHLASDACVTLHPGDVRNFGFPEGEYRYVIHAATEARARQAREAPLEMLSTITAGTERVLEFAASHGTQKFLLTSSGAVYGPQPLTLSHVPEDYSGGPNPVEFASLYGEGKRLSELLCAVFQKQAAFECKIARCWAFCGPHLPLNEHFAIGNFIGDVIARRPIQIQGDGTPMRSYLYAADLAIWLWTILFHGPTLDPINVGSSRDLSIAEVAGAVVAALDPRTEIRIARPAHEGLPSRYVPSVEKARKLLGLEQITSLNQAILRTARWHGFDPTCG